MILVLLEVMQEEEDIVIKTSMEGQLLECLYIILIV